MHSHRYGRYLGALLALYLAGLGGSPAQASQGSEQESFGIKLLEAPVDRRDDPRARIYVVDHLKPGAVIERNFSVENHSSDPQPIEVYPAAATVADGGFQVAAGRTSNELASWITLDRARLELEPGAEATVTMTVEVPPTASKGERYAVVWAEMTSPPSPSGNVTQVHRVGVRLYLDVGRGGEPRSDFEIGEVTPARDKTGEPSLAVAVTNTGRRAVDLTGSVSLSEGPAGLAAGPFPVQAGPTLGIDQSGTVLIRLPRELPNGPWTVEIALQSGRVERTATGTITFPDPGQVGKPGLLSAPMSTSWGTVAASLAVSLVAIGGLAAVARRSQRQRRTTAR